MMPSDLVMGALEAFKAGDPDVCRAAFAKMTGDERDEYLTATRELNANRSD
jgi:hypothetical protein